MQGGHRASVTHIITQVYEAIESTDNVGEVITKLKQCNIVLQEILDVARQLNNEILDLVDKNELEEEIGLADEFRVKVCRAITDSTKVIETKQPAAVPDTDGREVSNESATPTTLALVPIIWYLCNSQKFRSTTLKIDPLADNVLAGCMI